MRLQLNKCGVDWRSGRTWDLRSTGCELNPSCAAAIQFTHGLGQAA